jgi:hypothetical protein
MIHQFFGNLKPLNIFLSRLFVVFATSDTVTAVDFVAVVCYTLIDSAQSHEAVMMLIRVLSIPVVGIVLPNCNGLHVSQMKHCIIIIIIIIQHHFERIYFVHFVFNRDSFLQTYMLEPTKFYVEEFDLFEFLSKFIN